MSTSYRQIRRVMSVREIVARRRKRVRYTDFTAAKPVRAPKAVVGSKIADKVRAL